MSVQSPTSPRLASATSLLGEAFDTIYPCPETKESAIVLIARAERVVATIDPIVQRARPNELNNEIGQLNTAAAETKGVMQRIAAKSFVRRLIDQAHDQRDIEVVNLKLTDILRIFNVVSESEIVHDLSISEGARRNDQYHIEQKMGMLQSDDQALCQEFNVSSPNTALNAIRELQLVLISLGQQDSPRARHFLEHAMKVFRGRAGSSPSLPNDSAPSLYSQPSFSQTASNGNRLPAPPRSPRWVISEGDIQIDQNAPLGRGGFGTVFKGKWNGATVAVKRLVKDASAETLLREVELWQGLRHPHVVQFFGASPKYSPNAFIVSQYLANGNALMYLKRNPRADRAKLSRETAVGMEYLHSMGIIHGDLKAANVLITDTGSAALADFGLSEVKQDSSSRAHVTENVSGSPRYLSPERWRGVLNKASDVYAWAMTTLEIFTEQPPFGYINGIDIIYHLVVREKQRPDRPEPDIGLARGLTDDIWFLITKAWDQDPQLRPTFKQLSLLFPQDANVEPMIDDLQAQFASMIPNTASGASISISQSSIPSMVPVATTAPLQLPQRAQQNHVNQVIESAEIEILPPPSYDVAAGTPSATNLNFPSSVSNSFNTTLSSAVGPVTPPPNNRPWYPPEKGRPYSHPVTTIQESSGSSSQAGPSTSKAASPPNTAPVHVRPRVISPISLQPPVHSTVHPPTSSPTHSEQYAEAQPPAQTQPTPLASPPRRQMTKRDKRASAAPAPLPTALSISQSLMTAVNRGIDQAEISRLVQEVIQLAEDEGQARKLVEAGAIPHLITQFKKLSPNGEGINHVILALGLLSHDLLSANSIVRTGTAGQLMEISKSAQVDPVRACAAWCLGRMIHSDDIAAKFIGDGLPELLINWLSLSENKDTRRCCAWTLGMLARTDALAGKLVQVGVIPALASHLTRAAIPDADSEDLCVALFGVARLARTIKFSKALAAAGSVEPMVRTLQQTLDPDVLNWSARAVGCYMRPNSSDMAKILLREGAAEGLAKLPRSIPPNETDALGSFAFAIARFSCAEWGSGTRKALVQAGVVDALLSALRAASAIPTTNPQVHAELAFAVSFLGDVGGSAIRKEIQDAGGIDILKQVARQGPPDVRKACETAITTITGNVFTRSSASTKTALTHDWSGGCPEYPIIHPDFEDWH
ncbi:Putative serine/threonine-protein kinase/receptor R831 [Rhizoctonia solani AG-1 IB]|uniref:Putative serine/threonine-protein kinase/receptor R831 n=1 Tax=Thanatephorus cucumeris (strain AG1-IB / isolate 7/3/14) TaxID=1108050 RepID=M5BYZ0_THACB|nr:Putative serine/threonine-protein kinase/receptor R831 [Rhizoctonia solani AG-1 IB]